MNLIELKKELAAKEKRLNKVLRGLAEKAELEKKIAELKTSIEEIEASQNEFFSDMESAGITLEEAKKTLGLKGGKS
jgi:septal ring factor EnvC (AmiA/AmiB activator)